MQLAARPDTLREFATPRGSQTQGPPGFVLSRFQPSAWKLFRCDRASLVLTLGLAAVWVLAAGLFLVFRLGGIFDAGAGLGPWMPLVVAAGLTVLLAPVAMLRLKWRRSFFRNAEELEGIVRDLVPDDRGKWVDVRYKVRTERYSVGCLLSSEQAAGLSVGATIAVLSDPEQPERAQIKRAFV